MKTRQEFTENLIEVAESSTSSDEMTNLIHSLLFVATTIADAKGATEDRHEPDFEHIEPTVARLLGTLQQAYEVNLASP